MWNNKRLRHLRKERGHHYEARDADCQSVGDVVQGDVEDAESDEL